MANTVASRKAKGRNLQNKIRELLLETYKGKVEAGDIKTAIMGESGQDVILSPHAQRTIAPLAVEAKNVEALSIWKALAQCESNTKENEIPVLIFKRNYSKIYATVEIGDFLKLLKAYSESNKITDENI